ncbi:hypothetical protein G7054_g6581 [Neopestalotiopsis clavispora]|nr:hypothetical protein G7054_g6581 [Neopestalotiopsis clavispora]
MAVSSQSGPISSMDDYFYGASLEVPTVTEDWSDIFSPSNPFLQLPVGPLDPELAAVDSLLSSDDSPGFDYDSAWKNRDDSSPSQPQTKSRGLSRNQTAQQRRSITVSTDNGSPISGPSKATVREKNRLAASKCRKKKKLEEKDMEGVRKSLQLHNSILLDTATSLREEVLFLKNEVLKHGTCEFPPIQNYITAAASQLHNCTPDIEECAN